MFIIDRIEGDKAVIEGEQGMFHLPKNMLPPGAKEGDCLVIDIRIDRRGTKQRRGSINKKADSLWE